MSLAKRSELESKWIEGYEGLYKVSSKGEVISYKVARKGRLMSPTPDKDGYLQIGLRDRESKRKWYRVHRLVATAFISNDDSLPMVNHKDCNPLNNEISNLEWCDSSHNNKHRFIMGYEHKGESGPKSILTSQHALEIYDLAWKSDYMQKEIASIYGVSRSAISNIKYGCAWSHITKHLELVNDGQR